MSETSRSAIFHDIWDIIEDDSVHKPYHLFETILHTEQKDLGTSQGLCIKTYDISRDYVDNIADFIKIQLIVRLDTFIYDIYPLANNMEMTVRITKQGRNGGSAVVTEERFKAVYLLEPNASLPTNINADRESMMLMPPVILTLQLVDRKAMALRVLTVQGSFNSIVSEKNKDMKPDSFIKSLVSKETEETTVDNESIIDYVSIEKAQNEEVLETLTIPSGTKLIDLPMYLQNEKTGVYTGGCATYLQSYCDDIDSERAKVFFTYSLYRGDKFEESLRPIIFYIPPTGEFNVVSRTYKYEAGVLRIFTNPVSGIDSTKGNILRAEGDGFRTAAAETIVVNPVEIKDGEAHYKKTGTMTEVIDQPQPDGLNYAPHEGISANHFVETSKVLARKGEYIKVVVDNLDPDFYFPGAAVKVVYQAGDTLIQELYGVLHRAFISFNYQSFDYNMEKQRESHGLVARTIFDIYITGAPDRSVIGQLQTGLNGVGAVVGGAAGAVGSITNKSPW